jgi:hypothetical protein
VFENYEKHTIDMQKYVDQLLEIMQEAYHNRPAPRYLELPESMEYLRDVIDMEMSLEEDEHTMETIFGIPQNYFPPENRLSNEQIRQLIDGILSLWREFHYAAVFRNGEFSEREQYTKLVECWKKTYPLLRGSNGIWYIEMYDYEQYWDEESQCYLSDEEYFVKNNMNIRLDYEADDNDDDEMLF